MKFRVEISAHAAAEIEQAYLYIRADAPDRAAAWRQGLYQAAHTLEQFPDRCPIAPESSDVAIEVRQLLYGSYRILFSVTADAVHILHVRHRARRGFHSADLHSPAANP